MRILNLGCGSKASSSPDVVNIDWSIALRLKQSRLLRPLVPLWARGDRLQRFNALPDNLLCHNLAHGIPFPSESVDAVYHSHFLEHLDPRAARQFLLDVKRVLKPGGIQRVVVPDLEKLCRAYVAHCDRCADPREAAEHEPYIAAFIEQCVRREASGSSQQPRFKRRVENFLLGDARGRGEIHLWMYDRINLGNLLTGLGFRNPVRHTFQTSQIPDWPRYGLEVDADGHEFRPESLYLEVRK